MDIYDRILKEKREFETQFANALLVFDNADSVLSRFGWLSPSMFTNERIANMLDIIRKDGKSPVEAAVEADIFYDLSQNTSTSSPLNIDEYAHQIDESAYLLRSIEKLMEAMKALAKGDKEAMRMVIDEISRDKPTRDVAVYTTEDVHLSFMDLVSTITSDSMMKTGYMDIDSEFRFFPREMTIMAARPSVGKTTIALNIALNIASQSFKVLFMSLEMSKEELWAKVACSAAGVSWKDVRLQKVSYDDIHKVLVSGEEMMMKLRDTLYIKDDIWDVPEIIATVMSVQPDLVIIDHLGEIVGNERGDSISEVKFLGDTARTFRRIISRVLGIPVLLIHQLNRGVEDRQDKRAVMSDMRGSGKLEEIADNVIILYREDYAEGSQSSASIVPMEVIFRKMRGGEMNYSAIIGYDLKYQRFVDMKVRSTDLNPPKEKKISKHYAEDL
jgi:replicative DNA helicase